MFKTKTTLPQDVKDAKSFFHSRKYQERSWKRPLKVIKCEKNISSSGNASVTKGWRLGEYVREVPQILVLYPSLSFSFWTLSGTRNSTRWLFDPM